MELTSPNYPQPYDLGTHCIWNIIAPQGHYVTLDFERISVSNIKRCYFFTYLVLYFHDQLITEVIIKCEETLMQPNS